MEDFTTTDNYVQFIRITGPNIQPIILQNTVPGSNPPVVDIESRNKVFTFDYGNLGAGTYNIATIRQFYNNTAQEIASTTTLTISRGCRVGVVECPDDADDGAELGILTDINKMCYSVKLNGVWCAVLDDDTFIPRSRLLLNDFPQEAANCFAENDPFNTPNCPLDGTVIGTWNPGSGQIALKVREFSGKKFLTQVVTDRTTAEFVGANDIFQVRGKDFLYFAPGLNISYPLSADQLVNYCLNGEPTGWYIPLSFTVPSGYQVITIANNPWGDIYMRDNNNNNGGNSTSTYLSDNNWTSATTGYGTVNKDRSTDNNPLRIGGVTYAKGLGTHSNSEIIYNLNNIPNGPWTSFEAVLGRDDEGDGCGVNVEFQVFVDNVNKGNYLIDFSQPGLPISIDIAGKSTLKLVVTTGNDGNFYCDHADWADAKVTKNTTTSGNGCGSGTGLTTNYFNGTSLSGSPSASLTQGPIDFIGSDSQGISGSNLGGTNFSARYEGTVEAPVSGLYTFNMRTDDGTRVWFNNYLEIDDWGDYAPKDHNFTVYLTAGQKYSIKIEWKQGCCGYEAKLFWSYPGQSNQIVPSCRLYPSIAQTGCNFNVTASANPTSVTSNGISYLTANCTGDCSGVNYTWTGNGNTYYGISTNVTLPSNPGIVNYTLVASKSNCNSQSPSPIPITVTNGSSGLSLTNVNVPYSCNGSGNKTITFTLTGGTLPYQMTYGLATPSSTWYSLNTDNGNGSFTIYLNSTWDYVIQDATGARIRLNATSNSCNQNGSFEIINGGRIGVDESESIIENESNSVIIFPNPSTNIIMIKANEKIQYVSIYEQNGRNLLGENLEKINPNELKIDISKFPYGMYIFKVKTETGEFFKKVIKQ